MGKKFVYLFAEGNESMRELLGGKGANLAEMSRLGMPVPMALRSRQKHVINIMRIMKVLMMKFMQRSKSIGKIRAAGRKEVWRCEQSFACVCAQWCACFHARHDGYYFKSRAQ